MRAVSFDADGPPPDLHSFPTRRSSDLELATAHPLAAIAGFAEIEKLVAEWRPARLVVGLPVREHGAHPLAGRHSATDRKSTRLNSSHTVISYAVFCLKKKSSRKCSESS